MTTETNPIAAAIRALERIAQEKWIDDDGDDVCAWCGGEGTHHACPTGDAIDALKALRTYDITRDTGMAAAVARDTVKGWDDIDEVNKSFWRDDLRDVLAAVATRMGLKP